MAVVKRVGLLGGTIFGMLCYQLLPAYYSTGSGAVGLNKIARAATTITSN